MDNYSYMNSVNNLTKYPLKIYLGDDNNVVIMYVKEFFKENFEIQDVTMILPKKEFYHVIESLNKYKTAVMYYEKMFMKISIFKDEYKILVGDGVNKVSIVEQDSGFIKWLLSIDLRQSQRVDAVVPISVQAEDVFEYGVIMDLSENGFKVCLNTLLPLDLKVYINIFDKEYQIPKIECVIKRLSEFNDKFFYGLKIDSISSDSLEQLKQLIERETNL